MDETKTSPSASSVDYVIDGMLPVWFAIGSRPVGVEDGENQTPESFNLSQNYPNPFNPSTKINFRLAKAGHVSLKVYDMLGAEVATLVDDYKGAGDYSVSFSSSSFGHLASGVYIYRLNAEGQSVSKKMLLMK
jgi:hypothetical protein